MIASSDFLCLLKDAGISFYAGVPDSLLKEFCFYMNDMLGAESHIIAANEGNAIGIAAGYYLATGKAGAVYMQNSGLGNAINPLISLCDKRVYGIPVLLLIGWRGEPGKKDEPQHITQGEITLDQLDCMNIPYEVLPVTIEEAKICVSDMVCRMNSAQVPHALVIQAGTFDEYRKNKELTQDGCMSREDAISIILDVIHEESIIVATTGKISRELNEHLLKDKYAKKRFATFLTVGSMGHSSQIAMSIAEQQSTRKVYCLDGDGAAIMHMGGMAVIGARKPDNFVHILLNNGVHDSVGGQPTAASSMSFAGVAQSCGYPNALVSKSRESLVESVQSTLHTGLSFLEVKVSPGARKDLSRPKLSPEQNKRLLVSELWPMI